MSEQLLTILKLVVLAFLYLFFFRVLWAVYAELRPAPAGPAPEPPRQPQRPQAAAGHARQLVIVEPRAEKGIAYDLADELTIGRAAGCQITVDDTYVSQLHARLFAREGAYMVEDLGSTNGTFLNGQRVETAMVVRPGDRVKVGGAELELR